MAGSRHLNIVMPGNAQPSKAAAQKPKYLNTHAALQHKRGLVVCVEGFRKRRGRGRGEGKGIHAAQQECHEEDGADGSYVALHATDGRPQASQSRVEQRTQGYKTNIDGNEGGQVGSKSYRSQSLPCLQNRRMALDVDILDACHYGDVVQEIITVKRLRKSDGQQQM
jgi:hypothetical protein